MDGRTRNVQNNDWRIIKRYQVERFDRCGWLVNVVYGRTGFARDQQITFWRRLEGKQLHDWFAIRRGGNLSITITRVKVAEIKKTPRIISFGIVFPNECYIFKWKLKTYFWILLFCCEGYEIQLLVAVSLAQPVHKNNFSKNYLLYEALANESISFNPWLWAIYLCC